MMCGGGSGGGVDTDYRVNGDTSRVGGEKCGEV